MNDVMLNGGGRFDIECFGAELERFELKCILDSEEKDGKERILGRVFAAAAFFVIEIVDIVVCAIPESVISTELPLPKSAENLLGLVGLYAARGNTSEVNPDGLPPSETNSGTGKPTVCDESEYEVGDVMCDPPEY